METFSLDGQWTVTAVGSDIPLDLRSLRIPASVPGCVHLDLLEAGHIDEPFDGDNESKQQWIGSTDWKFERTFNWKGPLSPSDRYDLVAQSLDTFATVTINDVIVGRSENQNRTHRWDITRALRVGDNTIAITFAAPVPESERRERLHGGKRFHVNHHPYNTVRKTAANFGWDWGIDVATSGISGPISIETWREARIASVRPLVDVEGATGVLNLNVDLDYDGKSSPREVQVLLRRGSQTWEATNRVNGRGQITVRVDNAELWWPRGHGEQPLYSLQVVLKDEGGAALETWERNIGFRTVSTDTAPDADGTPFTLIVNGKPIMIRGANWIPDDAFVTRIDKERLRRRIADATDANVNLLRVWGGGQYETEDFYALCDEAGVMVWQDFLLACAAYAEEQWLAQEIEAEAREAIARLSSHPSLVLWCGNNENIWGYLEWNMAEQLDGRSWGYGYYYGLFPNLLEELDPSRPYIPGSPFSPHPLADPNNPKHGSVHIWDVWNQKDYTHYATWRPRFVSEFGFQGPPAWTTLFDVVHDKPADPYGPEMLVHQKADEGNLKLERGYTPHLPTPRTIDDWHFATQLNQAHAMKFGISHFRALAPLNTGIVIWQLNDNWPVISWAAVDYAERRKPLWYALRDTFAPQFATIQPSPDGFEMVVLNDSDSPLITTATLTRRNFAGEKLSEAKLPIEVQARGVIRVPLPHQLMAAEDPASEALAVRFNGTDHHLHDFNYDFADVVDQHLEPDALQVVAVQQDSTGATITVGATSYVRDIVVMADRADPSATVDNSLLSLFPGETATFRISADKPIPAAVATSPEVLRSANQLHGDPVGCPLPTTSANGQS